MPLVRSFFAAVLVGLVVNLAAPFAAVAAEQGANDAQSRKIVVGNLQTAAPADFVRQKPRSQIIAYEFSAPAAKGDQQDGRLTVMAAGGSVEANLDRWYGQFTQPDGKSTKERAKVERMKIAGQDVYLVDVAGTYDDKPAPFAEGVKRENYRLLGAIIAAPDANSYFKFYGPQKTVAAQEEAFLGMIKGLEQR